MSKPRSFSEFYSGDTRFNIRLENFVFYHKSFGGGNYRKGEEKYRYIRPEGNIEQLSNWLKHNEADSGAYLITGYRGCGKSSFVNTVLDDLSQKDKTKRYKPFFINLGQDNINEIEILRIITRQLDDWLEEERESQSNSNISKLYIPLLGIITFLISLMLIYTVKLFSILSFKSFTILKINTLLFSFSNSHTNFYLNLFNIINLGELLFCFILAVVLSLFFTYKSCKKSTRIKYLIKRLNATITQESGWSINTGIKSIIENNFSNKKSELYPPASIQEIEYYLISILNELKAKNNNLKIIFVFDELDKTDRTDRAEAKDDIPVFEKVSVRPDRKVTSRTRTQQVLDIIANMKYFLSTAKASFIFIAGREMYEAFQSDMSDRDFSISSIFSGIINIDSFLSSDRHSNNSTQLTERLICEYILPRNFSDVINELTDNFLFDTNPKRIYSLKNYYLYRKSYQDDYYENETNKDRVERVWGETLFLYHFVTYLSFISNGSPKKIILFFEKYIRSKAYLENVKKEKLPEYRLSKNNIEDTMFLSLGYYSICKVNFIHYLTYPIMQTIINRSNHYGDKLLVSGSFLVAHIFKLHNSGFSWRNIEQTPEILEINKTPEIREYISSIIDSMNHTHLTTIPCGLYHYKFPMRIVEEISYYSKISGEVSALFNFSRDELSNIKKHYNELLKYAQNNNDKSIYTQTSLHHSLGDIYMLEENFSSAIREYELCVEQVSSLLKDYLNNIQTNFFNKQNVFDIKMKNYFQFLNRTMLKLGLAHEKRRTDNSAFVIYDTLIDLLKNPLVKKHTKTLLENTRTFHLALLAKLYTLEKIDTTGITKEHIDDTINDFKSIFCNKPFWGKTSKLCNVSNYVIADFYRKLGDILYYKNQTTKGYSASHFYNIALKRLLNLKNKNYSVVFICENALRYKPNLDNKNDIKRDNYIYSLALTCEEMGHAILSESNTSNENIVLNTKFFTDFHSVLSNSNLSQICTTNNKFEEAILYYWTAASLYNTSCERGLSTKCHKEIVYTIISYIRCLKVKENNSYDLLIEVLHSIIKHFLISTYRQYEHIHLSENNTLKWLKSLEMYQDISFTDLSITPDAEEMMYIYYTAKLEFCQWNTTNNTESEKMLSNLIEFYNSPLMTNKQRTQTLTTTVLNLKLKANFNILLINYLFDLDDDTWNRFDFSYIDNYLTQTINNKWIIDFFFPNENPNTISISTKLDLLELLIRNGLFCLSSILELVTPLRNTTLFNNSFKGDIYYYTMKISFFYQMLYCYYSWNMNIETDKKIHDFITNWKNINTLTKDETVFTPDRSHNYLRAQKLFKTIAKVTRKSSPSNTYIPFLAENAIHYYTKARQMNMQGKTYQEMIRNLFFLEDDLNNDTLQFYTALERLMLSDETKNSREVKLKNIYSKIKHYDINEYISTD